MCLHANARTPIAQEYSYGCRQSPHVFQVGHPIALSAPLNSCHKAGRPWGVEREGIAAQAAPGGHRAFQSKTLQLRWPGDSQRKSGRFARIDFSELQTHPNLHSPVWVGSNGCHPQREGTNLGVFVPIWLVVRRCEATNLGVFDPCHFALLKRGCAIRARAIHSKQRDRKCFVCACR